MKDNKNFIVKILMLIVFLVFIIGLIWVGFTAIKMIDKWIGRKAQAEVTQKIVGGVTDAMRVSPFGK
jgi:uncharacterized SAM-binding protein YcdF (DUF218 family)